MGRNKKGKWKKGEEREKGKECKGLGRENGRVMKCEERKGKNGKREER